MVNYAGPLAFPQPTRVSQPTTPVDQTAVISATNTYKGGVKQRGGATTTTYTGPTVITVYKPVSGPNASPAATANSSAMTAQTASSQATNDNGAYSPAGTGWNTPGMFSTPNTSGGGRRRKTRKSRKSRKTRKSRKSRKHKRRNTYKK